MTPVPSMAVAMMDLLATNNFGDTREGSLAGPIGLVIILLLAVGTFLLIRNMNSRLKRLPERFPTDPAPAEKPTEPGRSGGTEPAEPGGTTAS